MTKPIDFLVVGHGLAGSLLAWRLIQANQRVVVVDDDHESSASSTAAGLVNPITGRRFSKDPRFETFLSSAKALYQSLEVVFNTKLFSEKSLVRIFDTEEERASWRKRKTQPEYTPYIRERFNERVGGCHLIAPWGGYRQRFCGHLNTVSLLNNLNSFYKNSDRLIGSRLSHQDLINETTSFRWKRRTVKHVIFCEGYHAINNPLFSWLPFQPSKGEVLTLKSTRPFPGEIISRGKWLLPLGDGNAKLGTTYQWQPIDEMPSEAAKSELLRSLESIFVDPLPFEIIDHKAGVRPNTMDKQPFIGNHPVLSGISIFNGFGSKGALTIPWYAAQFVGHLLNQSRLPMEADVARYYATHFSG